MSYALAFWADGDHLDHLDPVETYRALGTDGPIEGVRVIDREAIERALTKHLVGWRFDGNFIYPPGAAQDGGPAFDCSIGAQLAQFTGYGIEDGDHFNAIIDVMHPLGYRLFDPQTGERFG